jgi:hypothetical protein
LTGAFETPIRRRSADAEPYHLFALIFSTGILVDDAIVVVESVVAIAASLRTD